MRISTRAFHESAIEAMNRQQARLAQTQNQIATGLRFSSPADDPVAAVQAAGIERELSAQDQYRRNANLVSIRLSYEEAALADIGSLVQRARELAVQGNNSVLDSRSRQMLATEIRGIRNELMAVANRRDPAGEYLFAGLASLTQPFADVNGSVIYSGADSSRTVQISAERSVSDGHSGARVFEQIPAGNGNFSVSAAPTNNGTGYASAGAVIDPATWTGSDYQIDFVAADSWQVSDAAGTIVASGSYTPGSAIGFDGAEIEINGQPAAGDSFEIAGAGSVSAFVALDDLATALEDPLPDSAALARATTAITRSIAQLDELVDNTLTVRAEVGVRLSAAQLAEDSQAQRGVDLEQGLSRIRDLDYAAAVSHMNQQLLTLQAAQQSYTRMTQLSLFNYL
ncbi:MAG: flagellar hook-associated protein FlgL [Steroidobacteraceae bacterium]